MRDLTCHALWVHPLYPLIRARGDGGGKGLHIHSICAQAVSAFPILPRLGDRSPLLELEGFCGGSGLWLRSGAGRAQLATSRVTGPVLAASSTSEMLYRSQWSRSGLSECIHVAVDGHHLMPV